VADTGGTWALTGPLDDFSVNGTAGLMTVPAIGQPGARTAILPAVTARDVDVLVKVAINRMPTGNNAYVSLLARRGSSDYRGRLRLSTAGTTFLQVAHAVGDTETFVGSEVNAHTSFGANTAIWVRMQVQGASPTTVRMRAWADGALEPSTWAYTATDSTAGLQTAGAVGLQSRLSSSATSAPTVFSYDGFAVTSLS
jgi:hypothetical protein